MRGYPILLRQKGKCLTLRQCLILLTSSLILIAAFQRKPEMGQDWESYYINLSTGGLRVETTKCYWYNWFAIPLRRVLGSTDRALLAIKLITVAAFCFAYSRASRSVFDFFLMFVAIIYIPTITENYQELLRQGTAISLLLVAWTFPSKAVKYGLYTLAILFHFVSGLSVCLLLTTDAVFSARMLRDETRFIRSSLIGLSAILLFSLLLCLILLGSKNLLSYLGFAYLQGDRSNMMAMACLACYSIYLVYQFLCTKHKLHVMTFLLTCSILAVYPAITDFGRSLSLVTPFHLAGTFHLEKQSDRLVDAIAACAMGSIFTFV